MKLFQMYKNLPITTKAGVWFLICSFLQKGISMITTPIFTRLLTAEEFGRFSVFNSWYGILSIFVTLSLSSGVFSQGLIKFEDDRYRFSSSMQGLTLTLVVFWTLVYILFADFWNSVFSLTTVQMLALLMLCFSSSAFSFWAVEQRTQYNYRQLVILTVIVSVAKPLLGIFSVLSCEDKVTARIISITVVEIICYSYPFVQQIRKGRCLFHNFYWKYAVTFNLPLVPHYLSQTVLNSSDRIMIERMVGSNEAGIYSLAYSVSMMMTLFNNALGMTIGPWMFRMIKAKQSRSIEKIAYPALVFVAMVNLLLIALAPEAVRIFAPVEYYDAIWIIPPVAMSSFFMFMYDFFARYEFYFEKTKGIMYASIIGAVLNIVLNWLFIPVFGYIAAGYTTLACYMVYVFMHYVLMSRACKEQWGTGDVYSIKTLVCISSMFIALGFVIMFTYNNVLMRYGILCFFTIIMYMNKKSIFRFISHLLQVKRGND